MRKEEKSYRAAAGARDGRVRMAATLVAGWLLVSPASAQGVYIEGWTDCGQWIEAREQRRADYLEHHLIGLLNGLTLGHRMEFWRAGGLPKLSREAVFLWIDGFCRENPLSNVVKGAGRLYRERSGAE
jgi:hypothetical protein